MSHEPGAWRAVASPYRRLPSIDWLVALAITCFPTVALRGQPPTPRPHPVPSEAVARIDHTPPPLTPVENVWGLALNNGLTMPPAYAGSQGFFSIEGDRLVAYDLRAGIRQWVVSARPQMAPVAGGQLVFVRETDSLKALSAGDGSVVWELPLADKLAVHPVWDNGWLVLALATGEVRALRATDGHQIWSRNLASPAHAPPALASDRVYVPTTDHRIVALQVESGDPIWERRLGGAANEILALDDRLFAGSLDNFFYCVMTEDGRVDWRWRTGGDVIGKPVADDRSVYFVALDNVLRAMSLVTGGQRWMRPLPIRPAWGPVMAGTTIVVAGQTPPLRAYNLKDGVASGTLTGVSVPIDEPAPADAPEPAPPKKAPAFSGLAADAQVAAAPYVVEDPLTHAPRLLMLFKDIATGASATLVAHSIEPALVPAVAALPNLVQIAPVTPTTPPRP
jgi:outer membrane protein assembly factor BamB